MSQFRTGRLCEALTVALFAAALLTGSCDHRKAPSEPGMTTGSILIRLVVSPEQASGSSLPAAKVTITSGRLHISGEGMATIDTVLLVLDGVIEARILGIPVGDRQLELSLEDETRRRLWEAAATVTIVKNEVTRIVFVLSRLEDAPPDIDRIEVAPQVGSVDSLFSITADLDDVHDPTDSLEARWDFDDDGTYETDWSLEKTAAVSYESEGTYTVRLEARDRSNLTSSSLQVVEVFRLVAVAGGAPGADVVSTRSSADGLIPLDGSLSSGRPAAELIYHWAQLLDLADAVQVPVVETFSDNDSPEASQVCFSATQGAGLYAFTLQLEHTASGALSLPDTVLMQISSEPPQVTILDAPATVRVGETAVLRGQATDADGESLTYRWRGERVDLLSDTTSIAPTFTPDEVGDFHFLFVAIDGDPQESEPAETVIAVVDPLPVAASIAVPATGKAPLVVSLTNASENGITYRWSFGTGETSAEEDPTSHSYDEMGTYDIVLEVTGAGGRTDTTSQRIVVADRDRPDLLVRSLELEDGTGIQVTSVSSGQSVAFTVSVANEGTLPSPGFQLQVFLDGADYFSAVGPALEVQGSVDFTTPLWTADAGAHQIRATIVPAALGVEEINDGNDFSERSFSVNGTPVADAGPDIDIIAGLATLIDGSGSSDPDGDDLTYTWRQTAGPAVEINMATRARPAIVPIEPGIYLFTLVVSDGIADSEADEVEVRVAGRNTPPLADAGDNQTAQVGDAVTLDAGRSSDADEDALTFTWTQTGGPTAALSNPAASDPTFTASEPGTYAFSLTVDDGTVASESDDVTVTVEPPPNQPPLADAGPDQTVDVDDLVQLDGSGSSDPDGDTLTFSWTAPVGIDLGDAAGEQPGFTPAQAGTLLVTLTVNDGELDSEVDSVSIIVEGPGPATPVASAGLDQVITSGEVVQLDGSGSRDADGDPLSYRWSQTAGIGVELSDADAVVATFVAPDSGRYAFALVVSDGVRESPPDEIQLIALLPNQPPIADAGPDQTVTVGDEVVLDASGSSDPFIGEVVRYTWTAPEGIFLDGEDEVTARFTATGVGVFALSLIVSDGSLDSDPDEIVITILEPNAPPVADAGPDQQTDVGITVQLDGFGSSDPEDDVLSFAWMQVGGPEVTLSNADSASPVFNPLEAGVYVFSLVTGDGLLSSDPDEVAITVTETAAADSS